MAQSNKIIPLTLVILLGILVQVLFVFADMQETPAKAAVAFTEAYYGFNKEELADRLCESQKVVNDVNVVDQYIHEAARNAEARGYSLGIYVKNSLYHAETETLEESFDKARVRLTAERKSGLRTFFSKEDVHEVDATFDLVREGGKWKVCTDLLSFGDA
ncbi:hypothetical protein [Desulfococcus sp.]|uniref:hypothetical protein n=1 Tax=Desulfococcus sp. TaxID=2025834 RepID=UPI0035946868